MSALLGRTTTFFCNILPFLNKVGPTGPIRSASQTWSFTTVRTRMRYHFPRPSEIKRVVQQGFFKRMTTPGGRKVLMRRILKGRHVLGH